jgi:hypothetical protein
MGINLENWNQHHTYGVLTMRDVLSLDVSPDTVCVGEDEEREFLESFFSCDPMPLLTTQCHWVGGELIRVCVGGGWMVKLLRSSEWSIDFSTLSLTKVGGELALPMNHLYDTKIEIRTERHFSEYKHRINSIFRIYSETRFPWCDLHHSYQED